ncbi:unnamed protein product [Clavelina lepadiformis]|uniref:Uncharacterized protein n=1 Tax=Clavelina lepadiformis TaxID=159417 RepID=A0ABP0GEH8_CLALP
MMRTTTTHLSPREVDIQPITSNTNAMWRSAILHENQINRRSYAFILVLFSCKIERRIREVMSSIPRKVFMKSVDSVPRQLENLWKMRIAVSNFKLNCITFQCLFNNLQVIKNRTLFLNHPVMKQQTMVAVESETVFQSSDVGTHSGMHSCHLVTKIGVCRSSHSIEK